VTPTRALEDRTFLVLVAAISLAFAWILWPYRGAILWGIVFAIVFTPLFQRLSQAVRVRRSLAALVTILIILVIVIAPVTLVSLSLTNELTTVVQRMQSGQVDIGSHVQRLLASLPAWIVNLLNTLELTDVVTLRERVAATLTRMSQVLATRAVHMGQYTLGLVFQLLIMLYLLFFLLRDGNAIAARIKHAIPLRAHQQDALVRKFAVVIRATVKGNVVVALLQGLLGGVIFWFLDIKAPLLWAALMAILSLLPLVGAFLIWLPVSLYLLFTGATWQGAVLLAYGVLVISLVDNVVRPLLVGKDTKMPDYIVLLSTLGGLAVFGINGFIMGPLIAAMFMAVWDIFERRSDDDGRSYR
jgi:predicted PurR-regulated permease PerM